MAHIRVEPFGVDIHAADGETILGAVLRSGHFLRYGCKYGGCGACRVLLVTGDVDDAGSTFALANSAREQGWILACASTPLEDCVIDASSMELSEPEFSGGDQVATLRSSLAGVDRLTPTIYGVTLRLVDPPVIAFRAGQFVNVEIPGEAGLARAFSMANSPADNSKVELFVKRLPGGRFAEYLATAQLGDIIRLHGPLGLLRVRPSYRKLIMIAGGSGLAPILSMLADLAHSGDQRVACLFFGARTTGELYHFERIARLREACPQLDFVPVVQQPDRAWRGETGLVTTRSSGGCQLCAAMTPIFADHRLWWRPPSR